MPPNNHALSRAWPWRPIATELMSSGLAKHNAAKRLCWRIALAVPARGRSGLAPALCVSSRRQACALQAPAAYPCGCREIHRFPASNKCVGSDYVEVKEPSFLEGFRLA